MPNKLVAANSHNCDGIGDIDPCEPDVGRIEEFHGREVGLTPHEIDVQHFSDGSTRVVCEFARAGRCDKVREATREAFLVVIEKQLPNAFKEDMRFNVGRGKCKWEISTK